MGRSYAFIVALVSAMPCGSHDNFIAFGYQVINGDLYVWEAGAYCLKVGFDAGWPGGLFGCGVIDEIEGEEFIYEREVALVQRFIEDTPNERLVLFCWHDIPLFDYCCRLSTYPITS